MLISNDFALKYETLVRRIYDFDMSIYHVVTYFVLDKNWKALPDLTWSCPFWYLGVLSMLSWVVMVLVRAYQGSFSWETCLTNHEVVLWFASCLLIQPIFFCYMASYTDKWIPASLFVGYRLVGALLMLLFVQEVREKTALLQLAGFLGHGRLHSD